MKDDFGFLSQYEIKLISIYFDKASISSISMRMFSRVLSTKLRFSIVQVGWDCCWQLRALSGGNFLRLENKKEISS